jgi:hypothetical protein
MTTKINKLVICKPTTLWNEISVWAAILGTLTCIVMGSWLLAIVFACTAIVQYTNVQDDCVKLNIKPVKQGNHDLYTVKDWVDGKERITYVIADSWEELDLYCEFNNLKPGEKWIMGKANYFE